MKAIKLILPFLAGILVISGCNRRASLPEPDNGYTITGTVVKNLDTDQLLVIAALKRNDTTLNRAVLSIESDTLENLANQYVFTYNDPSDLPPGDYYLKINDTSQVWSDSVAFTIPGDIAIDAVTGVTEDRIYRSSDIVYVSFLISLNSDGYMYSVVNEDSTYSGKGLTEFVPLEATSVALNRNEIEMPDAVNDTIHYNVYIYSYTGSPVTTNFLPSPIPSGLTPNINRLEFSGQFGVVVVSPRDSLNAVAN